MSDYNSESFSDGGMPKVITTIVLVMIATIIVITVIIPFVSHTTHTEITNPDSSGIYMKYIGADDIGTPAEMTINVKLSNNELTVSGDYSKSVLANNQIIVLADNMCLYVQDGVMYYYNGAIQTEVTEINMTYNNGKLNGHNVNWVYFPSQNGIYSSYTSIDHVLSEKVGVKPGHIPTILTDWDTNEIDEKKVISDVKTRN